MILYNLNCIHSELRTPCSHLNVIAVLAMDIPGLISHRNSGVSLHGVETSSKSTSPSPGQATSNIVQGNTYTSMTPTVGISHYPDPFLSTNMHLQNVIYPSTSMSLAHTLMEQGFKSTENERLMMTLSAYISSGTSIKESDIAQVLGMMAATHDSADIAIRTAQIHMSLRSSSLSPNPRDTWNYIEFVDVILTALPYLNWVYVIQSLDYPDFYIHDEHGIGIIVRSYLHATNSSTDFPIYLFLKEWSNLQGQLSFIRNSLSLSPDLIPFFRATTRPIIRSEEIEQCQNTSLRNALYHFYTQSWNNLDLLEYVSSLLDNSICYEEVRAILELGSRQCPELLCIGLCMLHASNWNASLRDLSTRLVLGFLGGQSGSMMVLPRVWRANSSFILLCMSEMHRREPTSISRLLDISQELKILNKILDTKLYPFVIEMAALASRREHLNLEKWLQDNIKDKGEIFVNACMEFLQERTQNVSRHVPLSNDTISIFRRVLNSDNQDSKRLSIESSTTMDEYNHIPEFVSFFQISFPPDIEKEANAFYEKVYSQEIPVTDLVPIMNRLKSSQDPRDSKIFSCMIHNLLDEFRFFPKYPEKELVLTGIIFGLFIQPIAKTRVTDSFFSNQSLGIALRFIYDSIKTPVESKLFRFGSVALTHCKETLVNFPFYCKKLLDIPSIPSIPEIFQVISNAEDFESDINSYLSRFFAQSSYITFHCLQYDLFDEELEVLRSFNFYNPDEMTKDKILFILNNISSQNFDVKIKELASLLDLSYFKWFAEYLMDRISIEPNYHGTYMSMLEALEPLLTDSRLLEQLILLETCIHSRRLLNSEKAIQSSSDRSMLKNIGLWLGSLTLSRNKPILHRHLPISELLVEGLKLDRLLVVIPFVCKVLEGCVKSRLFKYPNPWLMTILGLLMELYHYADLKLNLKFEIEVLCKHLIIEISDINPSIPSSQFISTLLKQQSETSNTIQVNDTLHDSCIPGLSKFISLNTQVTKLVQVYPIFKHVILFAIEFAIREVGPTIVDRSVMISRMTTYDLICKDFLSTQEPVKDIVDVIKKAAQQMMQNLTGNLVLGTAKDPLKSAILAHLTYFCQLAQLDSASVSDSLPSIVEDNLELGCAYIEKAAIEKAIPDIHQSLAHLYSNPISIASWPLPDVLKPRFTSQQLKLYDDFVRISRLQNLANLMVVSIPSLTQADFDRVSASLKPSSTVTSKAITTTTTSKAPNTTDNSCIEQFMHHLVSIDKMISSHPNSAFSSFPSNHELRTLMKQILVLALNSSNRDEVCIFFSQKIIHILYKTDSILGIEVHVVLLDKLCELSARVTREVTSWVVYANDERKYNVSVTVAFFLSGLINVLEYDLQLAKHISDSASSATIEFACSLIRRCVLVEPVVAAPFDFEESIDALKKLNGNDIITKLIDQINEKSITIHNQPVGDVQDQVTYYFQEWMRLCQVLSAADKSFSAFVHQVFRQGFFRHQGLSKIFFRYSIQLALDSKQAGSLEYYSKWIAYIIRCFPSKSNGKIQLLNMFLSLSCGKIILENKQDGMNGLPRILSCLLNEWHAQERNMDTRIVKGLVLSMCEFLHSIRPSIVPEFAFGWLELVSHRFLFPVVINDNPSICAILLLDSTRFICPLLSVQDDDNDHVHVWYRGMLCWFLLLLHDFPAFLASYSWILCHEIPIHFIQLKNLILSAFPPQLKLLDPFTPNLRIEQLAESIQDPLMIIPEEFKCKLITEQFGIIETGKIKEWRQQIAIIKQEIKSDQGMMDEIVLYLGQKAIPKFKQAGKNMKDAIINHYSSKFFQFLSNEVLDEETRYYLYHAIANHLRYPNNYTSYFSIMMLILFKEGSSDRIREQITRVLLERLTVNRPHPWGLLITFIELIKNTEYHFWGHGFTRSSPDIERLFDSVARSCMLRRGESTQENDQVSVIG